MLFHVPRAQVILGPVVLFDQSLMDVNFADAALWVMARLEVDDLMKEGQPAPGSFTPFYVMVQRDASQTAFTLFRGSEDLWCVGQMILQPTPTWEVIITVGGYPGPISSAISMEYHRRKYNLESHYHCWTCWVYTTYRELSVGWQHLISTGVELSASVTG